MFNECVFFLQTFIIALFVLLALHYGKSALSALIALLAVMSNLFILKQITLFGYAATCCDAYAIGAILGLNILQEYYGKSVAQKAIGISFLLLVCYTIMIGIQLWYLPSAADTAHPYFEYILGVAPRITGASLVVYFLVQYLDSLLYAGLRDAFAGKYLLLRVWISLSVTQLVDTVLFSIVGLAGVFDNLLQVISISYIIKMAAILISTSCVALSRWVYQHAKQ